MEPIHVVIATVPWRAENLVKLVEDVNKQTVSITSITVILDGYQADERIEIDRVPDVSVLTTSDLGSGNWARWLYAQRNLSGVVVMIDDDFRILPDYVEKLYAGFLRLGEKSVVSWHGKVNKHKWLDSIEVDTEVDFFGSGLSLYHTDFIADLHKDPDLAEFVREHATDDGFMSCYFWCHGIKKYVVAGERPVSHDKKLASDKRCRGATQRGKREKWIKFLEDTRNWLKPPKSVVLYYSEGSMPRAFQEACFKRLVAVIPKEMSLRCVVPEVLVGMIETHTQGRDCSIVVQECETRGRTDLVSRLHLGVKGLQPTTPIALAEHDVLYGPGHFKPFKLEADCMWPKEPGIRLHLDNIYRKCGRPLLSMRASAACIAQIDESLEPDGKVIRDWVANYVDIRWSGNLTQSSQNKPLAERVDHVPDPLRLREWVNKLIDEGVDNETVQVVARTDLHKALPSAPAPLPPPPPPPHPGTSMQHLLDRRRKKRHV